MANNKKLTEEQEKEIQILLANNEMLEKTKKEVKGRGKKSSLKQIERAQEEVVNHINSIDPNALNNSKKKDNSEIFGGTDISMFDMLKADDEDNSVSNAQSSEVDAVDDGDDDEGVARN